MVTRADLDAWLSALAGSPISSADTVTNSQHTSLDVFPRVRTADFDPRLAGDAPGAIWWTEAADAAFSDDGALLRPMLLRWRGSRNAIQHQAAALGLTVRMVATEKYNFSGKIVLAPSSDSQRTDLLRLLEAFAALASADVIAIPMAGMTCSDGWSSVAERQSSRRQTAVFWHDQNHDGFDPTGMLVDSMCLYWRGSRQKITQALQHVGLTVETPSDRDVAFVVRSAHPAPTLPSVADAERFEVALPRRAAPASGSGLLGTLAHTIPAETLGYPVAAVWPSPDGKRLLISMGSGRRGSAAVRLWVRDATTFAALPAPGLPPHLHLGTARWLSADRALIAWIDYRADDQQKLVLSDWAGGETTEVLRLVDTHPGSRDILGVDRSGALLVLPRPTGVTLRPIGQPGSRARQARPGVRVRRKRALGPRPWDEALCVRDSARQAYGMVALSPDGQQLARTADGEHSVHVYDRSGAVQWSRDPLAGHSGSRGTRQLGFTPDGARLFVRTVRNHRKDGVYTTTTRTMLFDAQTGARSRTALEIALDDATCVAFHGDHVVAGGSRGHVRLLDRAGAQRAARQVFLHGETTAIAFSDGVIFAASSRGALAALRYD